MNYWRWVMGKLHRQLWWQAVAYGLVGIGTALLALWAELVFPWEPPWKISRDAVSSLLTIISSSMLAVTTFSLGAMTGAFGAVTANVTPRATLLLMEDRLTHNVLSSFIGAFVFSIVSIIVLQTGSYGERGRAVLFIFTIAILAIIVIQLLRWINHLISLGRVSATIERVEAAARAALQERLSVPYLGANGWFADSPLPQGAQPVLARTISYLQFIDMEKLSQIAEANDLQIYIGANAGAFLYEDTPLAWVIGEMNAEIEADVHDQFVTGSNRSFEQDPRFGLIVMAEIGSRALSSATNDAGTALDVIGRLTRLLALWSKGRSDADVLYPRLHLRPLSDADLFDDAFLILGRDGAHLIEIQLRLQKSLAALQRMGSPEFQAAASRHGALILARGKASPMLPEDLAHLAEQIRPQPQFTS